MPPGCMTLRMHSIGGWGAISTGMHLATTLFDLLGWHLKANPKSGSEKKGQPTTLYLALLPARIRVNGARFPGIASNFLCDLPVGSTLTLAGPVGLPFRIPDDPASPLLMIGLGTGAAPFRSLLYEVCVGRRWSGRILLFKGARTGLESVYRDVFDALGQRAPRYARIEVESPRPARQDQADLAGALRRHSATVWAMLSEPGIHVYLAGLKPIAEQMDHALAEAAGSAEAWSARKRQLAATGRWMALLY